MGLPAARTAGSVVDLDPPPKPRHVAEWLTPDEFASMLAAAAAPRRQLEGIAERDRLVLVALVTTGLRRAELIGIDWEHVVLEGPQPSALVRGKGDRPRRQPLAPSLVDELLQLRDQRQPKPADSVFCGLQGGWLSPKILASIVRRTAERAKIEKRVTAHTLRHTAGTRLRQQSGDARLVAEFLGHADLSTVARYAHVAPAELHAAADVLSRTALRKEPYGASPRHGEQAASAQSIPPAATPQSLIEQQFQCRNRRFVVIGAVPGLRLRCPCHGGTEL